MPSDRPCSTTGLLYYSGFEPRDDSPKGLARWPEAYSRGILFSMTKAEASKHISEIADTIVREFQPEKIILFGSWAWGTPGPDSDVDLFIVKESSERRVEREQMLRKKLYGRRFPPMDLLVYTPSEVQRRLSFEDPFVTQILTRGRVLYGQS